MAPCAHDDQAFGHSRDIEQVRAVEHRVMIRSQAGEGRGTGTARQDNVLCGKRLLAAVGGHDPHLVLSGADPAPVEQGHARVGQPFGQSLAGGLGITLHSFL